LLSACCSDDRSETVKTIGSSCVPELFAEAISDDVGLGCFGGFVSSSEFLELFRLLRGRFVSKGSSLGLVSLVGVELGSLELTSTLTGEGISGGLSFGLSLCLSLCRGLSVKCELSLPLSVSLGIGLVDSSLLGAGGSIGVFIS
jgi:hypothetical protein